MSSAKRFLEARDFLLARAADYEAAYRDFQWPQLEQFNWALDYFDAMAAGNDSPALWIVEEDGREQRLSFAELTASSNRVANWLRGLGVARGAQRDGDGYITYVGRADDVFKASDYRISPFELESMLIEHPAVAEAAVVPSPDPVRLAVPKAFIVCGSQHTPGAELARDILAFCRERLAPYKRIRRLEFAELPKTISGKIRRNELRSREAGRRAGAAKGELEFFEEDF